MKGKLIVIEGLDGSGKATQTALLTRALQEAGHQVRQVSFPNYQSDSSGPVRMYLAGDFGKNPEDVNPYAASAFYAVDRYAGYKKDWGSFLEDGGIVIADRYSTSNAIHQCCKLPPEQWDGYLDWLFTLEHQMMGIPAPHQVIYLRTDAEVSQKLMTGRYQGDESKKDIHEDNLDYQSRSRNAADYCAARLGWQVICCCREGAMRSREDIHEEIMGCVAL